jgi:crotonobetainyl-CoA:carnitine CoA-transferase CaiB-like acyl-CoA transferase
MASCGPLAGIRVLDFCSFINGSFGVQLMGDLGAEVIKVEPLTGDLARHWAPFIDGESRFFQGWNRNKRGIALDLASPEGRKIIHELARRADVLCENFRTGVTKRLGIDYLTISAINPRIIYCTSTGFGSKGPLCERPAYDPVLQSMGGAVRLNASPRFAGRPAVLPIAVSDYQAAMQVFGGVCAALYHRERTGEGQRLETSLLQAIMAMQSHYYVEPLDLPEEGEVGICPYRLFETSDDVIFIGAGTDKFWRLLCDAIDLPAWGADPRYACNRQRVNAAAEVVAALAPRFKTRTTAEWLERIEAAGVPCAPIWTMHEFLHHPQVTAMEMNPVMEHSTIGRLQVPGVPIHFDKTPGEIRSAPPTLGQHTEEVLREIGYDDVGIAALRQGGVIHETKG